MSGWKTKAGGILTGLAIIIAGFGNQEAGDAVAGTVNLLDHIDVIIGGVGAMLAVFGIGHKIDKIS